MTARNRGEGMMYSSGSRDTDKTQRYGVVAVLGVSVGLYVCRSLVVVCGFFVALCGRLVT